jgi:tripartite-type tricarboxylate transporter receptor subunit TctC
MINRRDFTFAATGLLTAAATGALPTMASAQAYPNQDIHFVTGFPGGSGADVLTRYFAEKLRPLANRTIVVENKVGASGAIAIKHVALAKPDGYTMYLSAGSATAAQMHLSKVPPVDVIKSFQIAATLNKQAFMIVVDAKSPYKTIAELTAAVKKKGKDASWAVAAPSGIVLGEMYKAKAGFPDIVEVRYKNAPDSLNDILSGRIDFGSHDPVFALAQQREGRLRILAHSAGKRLQSIPDIPTMTEAGVEMDLTGWWAVHVPIATPRPIVDQINKWFNQILATQETKEFLNKFGGDPFISTPDEAQALFIKEEKNWGEYVRIAKIEPQG